MKINLNDSREYRKATTDLPRVRPGTSERDSQGKTVPGETGMIRKPMSETHNWDAFESAFKRGVAAATPAATEKPSIIPGRGAFSMSSSANPSEVKPAVTATAPTPAALPVRAPVAGVPLSTQAQGTVTDPGTGPYNLRGERFVNSPGSATNGTGGVVREVNPRKDYMASFMEAGDPALPKGAAGGMIVPRKYSPTGEAGVASVSYGPTPTSRSGRIFDETGDVTSQYAFPEPKRAIPRDPRALAAAQSVKAMPAKPTVTAPQAVKPVVKAAPTRDMMAEFMGPPAPKPASPGTADFRRADNAAVSAMTKPPAAGSSGADWMTTPGYTLAGRAIKGWAENNRSQPGSSPMFTPGKNLIADAIAGPRKMSVADLRKQDAQDIARDFPQPRRKATALSGNGSQAQVRFAASAY